MLLILREKFSPRPGFEPRSPALHDGVLSLVTPTEPSGESKKERSNLTHDPFGWCKWKYTSMQSWRPGSNSSSEKQFYFKITNILENAW